MTSRATPSFLTLFLAALAVIFVIGVAVRIHSYNTAVESPKTTANDAASASSADAPLAEPAHAAVATDGTIVEASGNTTGADPSTVGGAVAGAQPAASRLSPRAQRFNELLNSAPAAAPPIAASGAAARPAASQPVAPASVPIAQPAPRTQPPGSRGETTTPSAFSGATASARPAPAPVPQPTPTPSSSTSGNTNGKGEETDTAKDPSSDTRPPQLMAVEFAPPQVQDGESAVVIITAVDDLSGIRSISGSVVSPSAKATQAFAAMREGDPATSNRFTARVTIPKDAEEGLWRLNFLSMSDNASNTQNLTAAQGGIPPNAGLKVMSNRPDSTPPSLKRVWLDKRALQAGEKETIFCQVEDDKTGVRLVSGVFVSPAKLARVGFGCRQQAQTDVWECDMATPRCLDCGDWQLEQITMQDNANNMGTARQDDPAVKDVRLNITSDSCDANPPAAQSIVFDPQITTQSGSIAITVTVADDGCGVDSVSGQVAPVGATGQTGRLFFNCSAAGDGGVFTGRIALSQFAAKGTYKIILLQVLDKGHNLKMYSSNDPVVANAQFTVK